MNGVIKEKSKELVKRALKAGKITKYEDFVNTELAFETKLDDEEVKYYKKLCEVTNG